MKHRTLYIYALAAALLCGCQRTPQFEVSGSLTGADGQTLYLEQTALLSTTAIDSCTLDDDGHFRLHGARPAYPELYRLRVGKRTLLLAVDSTESISVTTSLDSLPCTTRISGSEASLQIATLRQAARTATRTDLRALSQQVIISNPRAMAAYYALFLKQNGTNIWDINDPADRRMYQAVATSFHTWMPDYERTRALYGQVLDAINAERALRNQAAIQQFIAESENTFLDITLPDEYGDMQTLSDLRGKVIVLEYSAIEMEQSKGYIFELRELYNRYHECGMEIYSVSLDRNRLLWEQAVESIPWTTVRADQSDFAAAVAPYNVQSLPTIFLFDRKGNVQGRYTDFKQLDADIRKYL